MIVKYRRLYPYAPYLNEEIGFERSIPDESTDEEMIEAAIKLKEVSDKAHLRMNPDLSPHEYGTGLVETAKEEEIVVGDLSKLITTSKSKKELESFKLLVKAKNDPELETLYLNKLEELS